MTRRRPLYAVYALCVGLPIVGVILMIAGNLRSAVGSVKAQPYSAAMPSFAPSTFIVELIVILFAARVTGALFRKFGQPPVVGEMIAGIVLGPTVLGTLAPHLSAVLFPAAGFPYLNVASQLGLVIFMFLIGLNLHLGELRQHGHSAVVISHVSIAMPVFLGVALASRIYDRVSPPGVAFASFALFMGAAMSITAFPVLARILADRGMLRSPIGTLATACAAVDDVTGWCLLAAITVVARVPSASHPLWVTILGLLVFIITMIVLVRPLLFRLFRGEEPLTDQAVASAILFAMAAAVVTEYLGMHLLFGAFLAGAIMPRRPELIDYLGQRLETMTSVLLLPLFFVYSGLRTHIGLAQGPGVWTLTALIIAAAIAGKLGGSMIAAMASGIRWREATAIGVLMNTRGLMELVALNIGLDTGVISTALYSMLVFMALFTTFMTGPLLSLLCPQYNSSTAPASQVGATTARALS